MNTRICILVFYPLLLYSSTYSAGQNHHDPDSLAAISFEPLPIISYDTNTGLGYGAKAFLLNAFKTRESFDLILFNSSRGERWYHFVFSVPDFELRQGKEYPLSLDLIIDFDRWIAYHFYGIGNQSHYQDEEKYSRRLFETSLIFSRGFTRKIIGQVGLRYRNIANSGIKADSRLFNPLPLQNQGTAESLSGYLSGRYDSRNSFINPSAGQVVQLEAEIVPALSLNNLSYFFWAAWYQYYTRSPIPKTTLAFRCGVRCINGKNLPIQVLIPVGGGSTLRGYTQDRFLDKFSMLLNLEIRFPIYKRLAAIAGMDGGKVWSSPDKFDLYNWPWNSVLGLRYYRDTYVVRFDLGISKETSGLYINFGHVF
jgi:outer membrane protein assembly factor BamA